MYERNNENPLIHSLLQLKQIRHGTRLSDVERVLGHQRVREGGRGAVLHGESGRVLVHRRIHLPVSHSVGAHMGEQRSALVSVDRLLIVLGSCQTDSGPRDAARVTRALSVG